jgi:hypothetical protein
MDEELDEESFHTAGETVRRNSLSERIKLVKVPSEDTPLLETITSDPYVPPLSAVQCDLTRRRTEVILHSHSVIPPSTNQSKK